MEELNKAIKMMQDAMKEEYDSYKHQLEEIEEEQLQQQWCTSEDPDVDFTDCL